MKLSDSNLFFILGGVDNEMEEIRRILEKHRLPYWQPQTEWGNIRVEADTLPPDARGKHLVFVECRPAWLREGHQVKNLTIIDHHNHLCHQPASLIQVLNLLAIKPSIRQQIIASIDESFLSKTIQRWPDRRKQIMAIWQAGYRNRFGSLKEFREFKKQSIQLYQAAKLQAEDGLIVIDQAPSSTTMLSALCNLDQRECCLVAGRRAADDQKPCFYHGDSQVVAKLSQLNLRRAYWGKYYFGCREVPEKFITKVNSFRQS